MIASRPRRSNLLAISVAAAIAAFASVFSGGAAGQELEDPEIDALEVAYQNEIAEIRTDLGEKWLSALSNLKDQLTREQEFDQALLVRSEVLRVTEMLGAERRPVVRIAAVKKLSLRPGDATLANGLRLTEKTGNIGSWSEPGAKATWDVPADIVPGTYELILHYQAGDDGGGTFKVKLGDDQSLTGEISPSKNGSWKRKRSLLVGECVLDEHTGKLALVSINHKSRDLMVFNSIELAPPGTWAEMQSTTAAGEASPGSVEPLPKFEKLEGARWIDRDSRSSGEFVVRHGAAEHTFQLYFIQLPPTTPPTSRFARAELDRIAKQLRTSEDKILRFGKKVDEGLREAVWTEDLTIYTRWESRGREGRYLAYILVGDTPMSLTLVEQGHARIGGSFATEVPFAEEKKGSAKAFANRLRTAEKAAKKGSRGLWGL